MQEISKLQNEFNNAELQGDQASLERLLAPSFKGIGPKGFMLDKAAWIARHAYYKYMSLEVTEQTIQQYDKATIVWNIQQAKASHNGKSIETKLRATQVWVKLENTWQLAAIQFSEVLTAQQT